MGMKSGRNVKRKIKAMAVFSVLMIGAFFVSATLYGTFVTQEEQITVSGLLEFDSVPAGDLAVSDSFTASPNTTTWKYHTLEYVGNDGAIPLTLTFTANPSECITDGTINASVYVDGYHYTALDVLYISPGELHYVNCSYSVNMMAVPGQYNVTLHIDPA